LGWPNSKWSVSVSCFGSMGYRQCLCPCRYRLRISLLHRQYCHVLSNPQNMGAETVMQTIHLPQAPSLAQIVAIVMAIVPHHVWVVYGDSSDGGITPDTVTQQSIDALLAAGAPSANISWTYTPASNVLAVPNLIGQGYFSSSTLILAAGTLTVQNQVGQGHFTDSTLVSGIDTLTVQDQVGQGYFNNIGLTLAGGLLAVQDQIGQGAVSEIVLTLGGGVLVVQDQMGQGVITEITLTLAGGSLTIQQQEGQGIFTDSVLILAGGTLAVQDQAGTGYFSNSELEQVFDYLLFDDGSTIQMDDGSLLMAA